jgi:glycosyltransferase involved in cell wall biosynthesis
VIGVVGRISFQEKNQGWLLEQVAADSFWKDYDFIIVGDGPDSGQLVEMCHKFSLGGQVQIRGWTESVQTLYPALDLLLIPSRCEGVPLVMLEALAHKVPVAGTDRDGMKVWLRPEWRFKVGDGEGMKQAVLSALQQDETEEFWRATNDHLEYIHDRKRFAREFFEAINSLA